MKHLIWLWIILLVGCVTKVENTYTINGDSNQIKASDNVSAMPNNKDLVDLAGSGYGDVSSNGGKK
jgi:hypothetical protein